MKTQQHGMTLIGFVFILIIAGFFAYMAMKLVPAYAEYMGVVKTVKETAAKPGEMGKPLAQIRDDMSFTGSFQYVDNSTLSDARLSIVTGGPTPMLTMSYNKVIPFLYNISFLLHFKTSAPMNTQAAG
ncbi:MAG: DUF4845 domain-containing protein [Metallibacterium scheffleri]|jgi:hypothetical protein|uniref:DUF4845 domain-containing protein n=1 Tax=Metallibacterium scheffleri TaxID=993689 RepID=UPI0026ECDB2B|nr:DUF4845 domain-containing protein [Metallibacterium scheffleri]MCK9365850.1 DUF4845 domain-containing protein [Metallibacterium scheffleri]